MVDTTDPSCSFYRLQSRKHTLYLGLQRHQPVKHGVVEWHQAVQAAVEIRAQLHVPRHGGRGQTRLQRARLARLGATTAAAAGAASSSNSGRGGGRIFIVVPTAAAIDIVAADAARATAAAAALNLARVPRRLACAQVRECIHARANVEIGANGQRAVERRVGKHLRAAESRQSAIIKSAISNEHHESESDTSQN